MIQLALIIMSSDELVKARNGQTTVILLLGWLLHL